MSSGHVLNVWSQSKQDVTVKDAIPKLDTSDEQNVHDVII